MNKVVYNNCYGGFSLSVEAVKWLQENARDEVKEYINAQLKEYGDDSRANELIGYDFNQLFARHDKDLVKCVETLGHKANGRYAKLEIWHIQGNQYRIEEYDGAEEVCEPKDYKWITIEE